MNDTTRNQPDLPEALRQWASGSHTIEAAVGLLIAHGSWLRRPEFRQRAIWTSHSRTSGVTHVGIDWEAASEMQDLPASTSEHAILAIALSLADGDNQVDLSDALTSLDERNTTLVLEAIAHACSLHVRRRPLVVTGNGIS